MKSFMLLLNDNFQIYDNLMKVAFAHASCYVHI